MSEHAEPMVVDVDTGIDDALALLYACAHEEAQILGVSTVVGNVPLSAATRNTRAVLALAGRADIPVWPGAATALSVAVRDASEVHGKSGLGHAVLPEPDEPAHSLHALDSIVAAAHAHAGRLILVATGPLTNIALAVMREPELPRLVKRFVIMGGAYSEPGNVTPSAEFNIWHDPEAARVVFRAFGGVGGAPVTAIGLDVTRKTIIDEADVAAIGARCAGKRAWAGADAFPRGFVALLFRADGEILRSAHFHHARSAGARRRVRSDARRNAPRRRRRRDLGAAHDRRDDRRLARPVGPSRQHRSRRQGRRRALSRPVFRGDGPPRRWAGEGIGRGRIKFGDDDFACETWPYGQENSQARLARRGEVSRVRAAICNSCGKSGLTIRKNSAPKTANQADALIGVRPPSVA